jgi:hypothetical protein
MSFQTAVQASQKYFPNLQIKYKDQSFLMKAIGKVLFFNKTFMTNYTTTLGDTIYFPNEAFVKVRGVSSTVILLHEIVHIKDSHKLSKLLFSFLYACPQILVLLMIPLLFISWKFALLALLFALPIPALFRMYFEKRAYISSLYALQQLSIKMNFNPYLDKQKEYFLSQFKNSYYYYMWPFDNIRKDFDDALVKIRAGQRPYNDSVFDILDDLISQV